MKKLTESTKMALIESYKKCKAGLSEKRFQEATFDDMLQPSKDFLKSLEGIDLPYVEEEAIDLNQVLATSEKDLNPEDGTLKESVKKLNEAKKHREYVEDYLAQGGDPEDWTGWKKYISGLPQEDFAKASTLARNDWRNYIAKAQLSSPKAAPSAPVQPKPDYVMSDNLRNMMDMADAAEEFIETAADTVVDKYDDIDLKLRAVVEGQSVKRYFLLAGDPGIGKTKIVTDVLEDEGIRKDTPTYTGSIGKSLSSIGMFLWETKDMPLVILDDCDAFLMKGGSQEVVGVLKGCMEPGTGYNVHIPRRIANMIGKELAGTWEDEVDEIEAENMVKGAEAAELGLDGVEGAPEEDAPAVKFPTDWTYNAKLIILSNLHESQIDAALWSRCDNYDLHLTQEEYLVRLGMILNKMDLGQPVTKIDKETGEEVTTKGIYTMDEVEEARALTFNAMSAIIEAGNNGVSLFGRQVRLRSNFEFRMVKDLVGNWILLLRREKRRNGISAENEAKMASKIETIKKTLYKKWIRTSVIPKCSE